MSTFYNLPALGERVTLLTHFVVREDAQLLFGFLEQRRARHLPPAGQDHRRRPAHRAGHPVGPVGGRAGAGGGAAGSGRLVKVPGIGKKTAERLLLELKGKLGARPVGRRRRVADDAQADIVQALVALGYSEREAAAALKACRPTSAVADGIKLALRALSR